MTLRSPRFGIILNARGNVRDVTMQFAAKWGLEGFSESLALEIKSFGIRVTIIEPGANRAGCARTLDFSAPLPDYCDGPVAEFRQLADGAGGKTYTGDPEKAASIIADITRLPTRPLGLALDNDATRRSTLRCTSDYATLSRYRELSGSIAYAAYRRRTAS